MTTLKDLQDLLSSTQPPQKLLQYLPNGRAIPLYMYEAVSKLNNGEYHDGVRFSLLVHLSLTLSPALLLRGEAGHQQGQESRRPGREAAEVGRGVQEHRDRQQLLRGGAGLPQAERSDSRAQHLRQGERPGLRQTQPFPLQEQRTGTSQPGGEALPTPPRLSSLSRSWTCPTSRSRTTSTPPLRGWRPL